MARPSMIQRLAEYHDLIAAYQRSNRSKTEIIKTLQEHVALLKEELDKSDRLIELLRQLITKGEELKRVNNALIGEQRTLIERLQERLQEDRLDMPKHLLH